MNYAATWGGMVPHRWGCAMPQGDGVGTRRPVCTSPISKTLAFASPVTIDVAARWAAYLVNTRSPFNSWEDWRNVSTSTVSCSRKQ